MLEIRGAFEAGGASGAVTIAARSAALDELVRGLWERAVSVRMRRLAAGIGAGGCGRVWTAESCFPTRMWTCCFCWMGGSPEKDLKDAIRRVNQEMWDCGIRVSPDHAKVGGV